MRIGIIGAGEVASTLARLWVKAGHEVMLSTRNPDRLHGLIAELGPHARAGTVAEAAAFGTEAVLLAVNYWTVDDALAATRDRLNGKVVIDATNPLEWLDGRVGGALRRMIPDDVTAGEVMARKLPRARVVKAFTTPSARAITSVARDGSGTPVAGPFATDDDDARAVAEQLVRDAGLVPVDLGGLSASAPLDPGGPSWGRPTSPSTYHTTNLVAR